MGKQMSGIGIREICNRTKDKLQYGGDELQLLIDVWIQISSHPIGENDLWFHTYWFNDDRVNGEDRDKAFAAGLDLIQRWIQNKHDFQLGSLVRRAMERAAWDMGDARPLLVFTMLGPDEKADFLDLVNKDVSISSFGQGKNLEDQNNQARGSGDLS